MVKKGYDNDAVVVMQRVRESGLGFYGAQMIFYLIFRHVQTTKNCY